TTKEGGVSALVSQSCCTYIDQSGKIESDINNIWEKVKVLQEVAQNDTSWGYEELWNKLTSWLPNLYWIKHLFAGFIIILVLEMILCIILKCAIWCCQSSALNYGSWKKNKVRHQIETGKYFART
ncbi:ERVV2 protein, partial [Galbula dea]|nr:ERVV2 protein [Galbula dea]